MSKDGALLSVRDLKKRFPDGTEALKGVSTDIQPGEFLAIIGSSGAGKSTFLRCINRLFEPTSGSIVFDGQEVVGLNSSGLRKVRRKIGMIFQSYNLVKRSSTIENILHGRLGYMSSWKGALGLYSKKDRENALELLGRVGLSEQRYKRADALSGGQQQRVGIARAIAQNPKLILADEPIASLDPKSSQIVLKYLKEICSEEGITCIINLHQVDFAKEYADRIIGIKDGLIVFDGKPAAVTDEVIFDLYGHKGDELDE